MTHPFEHESLTEDTPGTLEYKTRTSCWHGSLMIVAWILVALSETLILRYIEKTKVTFFRKKFFIDQVRFQYLVNIIPIFIFTIFLFFTL